MVTQKTRVKQPAHTRSRLQVLLRHLRAFRGHRRHEHEDFAQLVQHVSGESAQ